MCFPDNVKSLWNDLRDRYSLYSDSRILELRHQTRDCRQLGRLVAIFFGELHRLQDQSIYCKLSTCMCSTADEYIKLQELSTFINSILRLDPKKVWIVGVLYSLFMQDLLSSLNVAYPKIITNERRQDVLQAQEGPRPYDGFAASSVAPSRGGENSCVCCHCGKRGHDKDPYYDLHGCPDRGCGGSTSGGGCGGRPRCLSGGRSFIVDVDNNWPSG